MVDSRRRAEKAETEIGAYMEPSTGGADLRGAYGILKRWYQHASTRATNPSLTDMEKFGGEFQTLYQREEPHPPGLQLATHVDPSKVNDAIPLKAEVEAVVSCICPQKSGRHTHLHAENFKQW